MMTESLASRVGRVLSGTVNMLVDAVEDVAPEIVMDQAIREVDQAIDEVRAELGKVIAKKHLATTRIAEENRKHDELSEKIRLAVSEGREDLAEAAVARLLDIEAQVPVLEAAIAQASEGKVELEGYVSALRARKREMDDELGEFRASMTTPSQTTGEAAPPANSVDHAVQRAESAFDRVLERASGLPGGPSAPDRKSAAQLAELDALERDHRIKERLADFRASVNGD